MWRTLALEYGCVVLLLVYLVGMYLTVRYQAKITGCTHEHTEVVKVADPYGDALSIKCKNCPWDAPLRELQPGRPRGEAYTYKPRRPGL